MIVMNHMIDLSVIKNVEKLYLRGTNYIDEGLEDEYTTVDSTLQAGLAQGLEAWAGTIASEPKLSYIVIGKQRERGIKANNERVFKISWTRRPVVYGKARYTPVFTQFKYPVDIKYLGDSFGLLDAKLPVLTPDD